MIWYSPELVFDEDDCGAWHDPRCVHDGEWSCNGRLQFFWKVDCKASLWIAISDVPVPGALAIDLSCGRFSATVDRFPRVPRLVYSNLRDLLAKASSDRVWLWIEVPDDR